MPPRWFFLPRLTGLLLLLAAATPAAALDVEVTDIDFLTLDGTRLETAPANKPVYPCVNISVTGGTIPNVDLQLTINGDVHSVRSTGARNPGGWYFCTAPLIVVKPDTVMTAVADPAGNLAESDEENNSLTIVHQPGPSAPLDAYISPIDQGFLDYETATDYFQVPNAGDRVIPCGRLILDGPGTHTVLLRYFLDGLEWETRRFENITAGDHSWCTGRPWVPYPGPRELTVTAEIISGAGEGDLANNTYTQNFSIPGAEAELAVTPASITLDCSAAAAPAPKAVSSPAAAAVVSPAAKSDGESLRRVVTEGGTLQLALPAKGIAATYTAMPESAPGRDAPEVVLFGEGVESRWRMQDLSVIRLTAEQKAAGEEALAARAGDKLLIAHRDAGGETLLVADLRTGEVTELPEPEIPGAGFLQPFCGTSPLDDWTPPLPKDGPRGTPDVALTLPANFDIGHTFYTQLLEGDPDIAMAWLTLTIASVNNIFASDANMIVTPQIVRLWETPDPFPTANSTSESEAQLQAIRDYYNANPAPNRDSIVFHHVLKGATRLNGRAFLAPCNPQTYYGVTSLVRPSSLWRNTFLIAHEIGHNAGSPHTHCYNPPIDTCWARESGCYDGPENYGPGTIMSYCNQEDEGEIRLDFHPTVVERMRALISAGGCAQPAVREERTVTLSNTGAGPLRVWFVDVIPTGAAVWAGTQNLTELPAGESQPLVLSIDCFAAEDATVRVFTSDPENSPVLIPLAVQGQSVDMDGFVVR